MRLRARRATLTVGLSKSRKAAKRFVRKEIEKGYKRIDVGARLAGIISNRRLNRRRGA